MPGLSGLEILRMLREKRPALAARFLLMTGNLNDAEPDSSELASVRILRKPFTLAQLLEAAEAVLAQASAPAAGTPAAGGRARSAGSGSCLV